jgi:hypothetical protein
VVLLDLDGAPVPTLNGIDHALIDERIRPEGVRLIHVEDYSETKHPEH